MNQSQRVALLVDFPNILKSASDHNNSKIDANFFFQHIGERQLIRAIAYVAGNNNGSKFQHVLKKLGFEVKVFPNGKYKLDCDSTLIIDAVSLCKKVDVIIIGAGDGDYIPLCEYLKFHGVRTEIMAVEQTSSYELIQIADQFTPITSFIRNGDQK